MLYRHLVVAELEEKLEQFREFGDERTAEGDRYREELVRWSGSDAGRIAEILGKRTDCGAFPSAEFGRGPVVSFDQNWRNHEEARSWALGVLGNRTTFAADGSQLFFDREVSVPVGAVQVGWFENPHTADGAFTKDVEFLVITPGELMSTEEPLIPETRVSQRRFELEISALTAFLERKNGWATRGERIPVGFFDGTLLLSIALPQSKLQETMITRLKRVVEKSEECRVPIVGYVDRSFARDLMTMLDILAERGRGSARAIDDISVFADGILPNWGDRSPYFFVRRHGLETFFDDAVGESLVGALYLRTTANGLPARLDVPAWIYRDGLLDEVTDVVRAECVVGVGYPYVIESADQTAVISHHDREAFFQALSVFAERTKLPLNVSRKAASKGRRR